MNQAAVLITKLQKIKFQRNILRTPGDSILKKEMTLKFLKINISILI